ncbi:MAG: dihydroorotase family protein [Treponema sp.]|nr:dihydroorotase family protein [Treponema sp.]
MQYDLIIKNGTIVTAVKTFLGDVGISNGKIAATGTLDPSDSADEIYDAAGKHVLPGIIDAHVHFRDPGFIEKEDFETGSIAAAMGGITLVADMPNVDPVTSTADAFTKKAGIAKEKSCIDFALFALLNNDNTGEMAALKENGAIGFKVFFGSSTGDIASPSMSVLTRQIDESVSLNMRIGFHAELNDVNENFTSIAKKETDSPDGFWLDYARPVMSEVKAMAAILNYSQFSGAKIHFHHVTSEDGAVLSGEAKEKGIDLTVETCPHYLVFNCEDYTHKVYPPIRDESHRDGLWEAINKNVIDMIASDHAPHLESEKSAVTWETPAGLSGVETSVSVMLDQVNKGKLTLNDYVRLASEMPAKIWGIYPRKGNLNAGADADLTIVDMNRKKVIRASELHSKNKTSPYDGMEVQGIPVTAIVRGAFVMRDGIFSGKKGYGILIKPQA